MAIDASGVSTMRPDLSRPLGGIQVRLTEQAPLCSGRFTQLSRVGVEAMLGLSLQESRVYQEAKAEGEQIGRQEGEKALVLRLLSRQVGELPEAVKVHIHQLSLEQLESLGEALLDFTALPDLMIWQATHPGEG